MKKPATKFYYPTILILGLISAVATSIFYARTTDSTSEVPTISTAGPELYALTADTTLPFTVSGIITADDEVVVRARTSGLISSVFVREGDTVTSNERLAHFDTEVLDAHIQLQQSQNSLADTGKEATELLQHDIALRADAHAQSLKTTDALKTSASTEAVAGLASQLAVTLEIATVHMATTLDFIDAHRSYFTGDALRTYRSVVSALYGNQPSYLGAGILYPTSREPGLKEQINHIKQGPTLNSEKLSELSMLLDTQLSLLQNILEEGEHTFLDERTVSVTDELYTTFATHRTNIATSQNGLHSLRTALQRSIDTKGIETHADTTNTSLALHDATREKTQAEFASTITQQNSELGDSQLQVLYSQRNLAHSKAPFSGTISKVFVERGEYVREGDQLFTLTGSGARELIVHIPLKLLPLLNEGQSFKVDNEIRGTVSRFAPVATAGSVEVFIDIHDTTYVLGEVLVGELELSSDTSNIYAVPREYIHFTNTGPSLRDEVGEEHKVSIIHDTGTIVYVRLAQAENTSLRLSRT